MGSKVESESYIPVGSIYFEEREDGLLHEKEMLKRTMLQHELTFKNQVHELHRLYRVQRDLMQEYQQNNNNSQTNSFSSQNPTNTNNNNFEFIREDNVQSSSKNLPIFPIPSQNQNQNRNVSNISTFGRREIVDLNEDGNDSNIGKKGVLDLNEDANNVSTFGKRVLNGSTNGSALDFMGVNKRLGFDEGSGSGSTKFGVDNNREKGINNFFHSQINPFNNNNNANNNPNNSFYMNFKPAQQSIIFPNQFSINPQLFPQSLTINFDPSQINNNNENNNNNNNVSYPVLDSSPHYINLDKNKNKSPIPSFIHTVPVPVPVFNNGGFNAGTNENLSKFVMDSANSSFYFNNNFSKNPTHSIIPLQNSLNLPRNPNPTSIFGNPNPNSNSKLNLGRNSILNLNEPAQDGTIQKHININTNNNNKGVKIFGANCEKSKETNNNKSIVHESNIGTKLLGFPVFTNPSSNSSNEIKSVPDSLTQKPVPESESGNNNKRTGIDLNETYYSPQENNNNNTINNNNDDGLNETNNKGKKPIISFDLNEDLSSSSQIDSSELEAAHNILTLSSKTLIPKPSPPLGSDPLSWFADLAVVSHSDPFPESEPDTDSYEQMVLNLQPITTEDRFGPDKYKAEDETGQTGQTGQEGFGCMLYSKGKRGPARKRRQKRDFQRDILPALASLSRVEVSEDLQLIGGLVRASGQEFDMAVTRRVGRSGSNRRRTAPPPAAQTGRSDPPCTSTQPSQTGRNDSLRGSTQVSWNEPPRGSAQGSQTGRNDPLHGSAHGSLAQAITIPVGIPPRFSLSQQMGLVRVEQVRGEEEMNLVHVNQQTARPQESQIQQNVVIGWEKFTRRARRPRGPAPAQHHHHHQQQNQQGNNGNNNNNDRNNSGGDL